MIIDSTYFKGLINIPNIDNPEVSEDLDEYIEEHEPAFLREVLGLSLYNAYKEAPADYADLINGVEYINGNGKTVRYEGLEKAIAHYTWFHWTRDKASATTGVGEAINQTDNAKRVSPASKLVRVWNKMIDYVDELRNYLYTNRTEYTQWYSDNVCYRNWARINELGI